jgi:hypothetical protein
MIATLIAIALSQTLNLNAQPIKSLSCDGGVVCTVSGSKATIIGTGGGGGGGGVTSVTASSPLSSSGGTTPNISLTGTIAGTSGGFGAAQPTCGAGQFLTCNGTTCSCGTPSGGGGGSGVNVASGSAYFDGGTLDALTTVTAAWASGASVIVCRPTGEESSVEGAQATVISQSSGNFVVRTQPRQGSHWGDLPFVCLGN